jgi:hypothetical protein
LTYTNDFYAYNADSNTWRSVAVYPGGRMTNAVAFSINGKGYVCCGKDSISPKNKLWEYSPDSLVGINELMNEYSFLISPNPAADVLYITSNIKMQNPQGEIYSSNGELMSKEEFSFKNNIAEINLSDLTPGIYFIRMKTKDKTFIRKFVKE